LDPEKVQRTNALKKKVNPTRVPIEEKESYRWLENVRLGVSFPSRETV
jgi:hypothetical protein